MTMIAEEHPFAEYVRILGKGKRGSRSLTADEAESAMGMILDGKALDVQLGAFLMLLRVKEETPDELAGFVRAAKQRMPDTGAMVDLDWSSYAGKRRHSPWFILAWLLLAQAGLRVFIHGAEGHTAGRLYTRHALALLGLPIADDWNEVPAQLDKLGFCYLPLGNVSRRLADMINLRSVLGLRSPIHSMARLLNPLNAPTVIQGIFHPPYSELHQRAGELLGYPATIVLKGEGGEIECNPDNPTVIRWAKNGQLGETAWPALFSQRHVKPETIDAGDLAALWRGTQHDSYGEGAVLSTTALALFATERAPTPEAAMSLARALWQARDRQRL